MHTKHKCWMTMLAVLVLFGTTFVGCGGGNATSGKGPTEGKSLDDEAAKKIFDSPEASNNNSP